MSDGSGSSRNGLRTDDDALRRYQTLVTAINDGVFELDADLSRIPVIILTSSDAEEDVTKSYELHANAYLTKPVHPDEFLETVQSFQSFWLSVVRLPACEGK